MPIKANRVFAVHRNRHLSFGPVACAASRLGRRADLSAHGQPGVGGAATLPIWQIVLRHTDSG